MFYSSKFTVYRNGKTVNRRKDLKYIWQMTFTPNIYKDPNNHGGGNKKNRQLIKQNIKKSINI